MLICRLYAYKKNVQYYKEDTDLRFFQLSDACSSDSNSEEGAQIDLQSGRNKFSTGRSKYNYFTKH